MDDLLRKYSLSQPTDGRLGDTVKLPPHGSFQHYNPVVVIDRAHGPQSVKDFIGCKRAFDNPV